MEQKQFSPTDSHFEHSSFQHSPSTPAASLSLQPIAYIHSDFSEKLVIPRQSRQDSAEIKEKEYLPVVRLSAQTLLDYPLYA